MTVRSLSDQTLVPDIIMEIGYPTKELNSLTCGRLVCYYANKALKRIDLKDYDFLLKTDEDVFYPRNFIETNVETRLDLVGGGSFLWIRVKPFLEVMNGRFIPNNFHAGLIYRIYRAKGYNNISSNYPDDMIAPKLVRGEYQQPVRRFYCGIDYYRFSQNPLSTLKSLTLTIWRTPYRFCSLLGFLYAGLRNIQRYTFS